MQLHILAYILLVEVGELRLSGEGIVNISQYDGNAVLQATQWKFVNNDNPNEDEVRC